MLRSVVNFLVVVVVVVSCSQAKDLDWWKVGPVYQVFPASFLDTDGDGWGDLKGIAKKVDYLKDIGALAVWLSPIYPSPMRDNGYDPTNFTDVNPKFGTLADADDLIKTYHDKGLKVVLDFIPNHTSNESEWFKDSVKKANNKTDWYVWRDPKGFDSNNQPLPPNNWRSTFGGSAWKYVESRKQFYYHVFGDYQPDLNYDNQEVKDAMKDCFRFWLRKGVDGFRMDAVPFIVETDYVNNEPTICKDDSAQSYQCLDHIYTWNREGTHKVLREYEEVLKEKEFVDKGVRAMWLEANNNITELMTYYGTVSSPFNFQYISYLPKDANASVYKTLTDDFMNNLNKDRWPNWVVGNHDNSRVGTRMGPELIDSMTIITQLMPGTSFTYYGEEIGMTDAVIDPSQRRDWAANPSRDPERTPMQWNASTNAGFSAASSLYLPVNPNYNDINTVAESKAPSHLSVYKKAVELHNKYINTSQEKFSTATFGDWVFAFQRPGLLVVTNLDNNEMKMSIDKLKLSQGLKSLKVELASINANMTEGITIKPSDTITIRPKSSIVFSTINSASSIGLSHFLIAMAACLSYFWNY